MPSADITLLANGLAVAADAFAIFLITIAMMVIGLTGLLAMCFRSMRTMYVFLGLVVVFVLLFQPWRVWTQTPPSPKTDSEWESAQDFVDLLEFYTFGLVLFTAVVVSATVYQVRQHAKLEEELRQLKSRVQEAQGQ